MRGYFEKFLLVYEGCSLNVKVGSWTATDRLVPRGGQVRSKSCKCLWRTKKTHRAKVCLQNHIGIKRLRKTNVPKIHPDSFIHGNSEIRDRSFDSNPPRTISSYSFAARLQCSNANAVSIMYYITGLSSSTPVNDGHWLDYRRPSLFVGWGSGGKRPAYETLNATKGILSRSRGICCYLQTCSARTSSFVLSNGVRAHVHSTIRLQTFEELFLIKKK